MLGTKLGMLGTKLGTLDTKVNKNPCLNEFLQSTI